ncbi:MAG: threonine synthase [Myxococcaceae bacterium]
MQCVSTRGGSTATLTEAMTRGLAPDGGLYVVDPLPRTANFPPTGTLHQRSVDLLRPFFYGEALGGQLDPIVKAAFDFDAPTRWLDDRTGLLELFHGPTAAFKDFGARFLAECLTRISSRAMTVLVATSGDTGAAVASAFHRRDGVKVVVLYPDGRVSQRQAHTLGSFGENVTAYKVRGTFDDCQRMVKAAFASIALRNLGLTSANSISLGRLLPQVCYYAHASLAAQAALKQPVNFIVPTGNLGNGFACLLARKLGLPIGEVVLATNANRVLPDYLTSGDYRPRESIATLANAMDVGAPSNLERLRHLFTEPAHEVRSQWVDDEAIKRTIGSVYQSEGVALCPHTACGYEVLNRLRAAGDTRRWIVVATAHPAKFEEVVEPVIGRKLEVPAPLQALLDRPSEALPLEPEPGALVAALSRGPGAPRS